MDNDLEKKLLDNIKQSGNSDAAVEELIDFYVKENVPEKAVAYLVKRAAKTEDVEKVAYYALIMGTDMEHQEKYGQAILFYSYGLSLKPETVDIQYFLNNNMGYSMNILGYHPEAQVHCELAIQINPNRHNAYKNLGISLQEQGSYTEAACNFMQAVRIYPDDPRALKHLEDLLDKHPEVVSEVEGIEEFMQEYGGYREEQTIH